MYSDDNKVILVLLLLSLPLKKMKVHDHCEHVLVGFPVKAREVSENGLSL